MKTVLKKILPKPILNFAKIFQENLRQLNKPFSNSYTGENPNVLQCTIAYNKYGGYCVPQSSFYRPAAQKILSGDIWEPDTIEFMAKYASQGDIVHAGTYFGDFIPALSQACASEAVIWAFEPNPENYRCALITCTINKLNNVQLKNAGLGEQNSSLYMKVCDDRGRPLGGSSQLLAEESSSNNSENFVEVDVLRLDDVVPSEKQVSIVQLDVEGFERQALAGAMETIKRCHPILILENLPDHSWLSDNIFKLGYQISGTLHENTVLTIKN